MSVEVTPVIFRKWRRRTGGDGIIAMFPTLLYAEPALSNLIMSYEHIGQHGGADYDGLLQQTKPATPHEYAALKEELESIGYKLFVCKHLTQKLRASAE